MRFGLTLFAFSLLVVLRDMEWKHLFLVVVFVFPRQIEPAVRFVTKHL